jgi:2-isopropylmalate synthase
MRQIQIYDTTLRDGSQREGISYSVDDKLKIAQRLDEFGVHYIEGGWPGSNPKDAAFFQRVQRLKLNHARITAFGMTLKKGARPEGDENLQALLAAETPVVTLVGKSWDFHVHHVLETSLDENLAMIGKSVAYFKDHGKEVIYDAEHFFDGYKANPEYALATLRAAAESGADMLVLCETNGGALPWDGRRRAGRFGRKLSTPLGIHTRRRRLRGANMLAAVRREPSTSRARSTARRAGGQCNPMPSSQTCSSRWASAACGGTRPPTRARFWPRWPTCPTTSTSRS